VCVSLCTTVIHNAAQSWQSSLSSYRPDKHHCSDVVHGKGWDEEWVIEPRPWFYFKTLISHRTLLFRLFCRQISTTCYFPRNFSLRPNRSMSCRLLLVLLLGHASAVLLSHSVWCIAIRQVTQQTNHATSTFDNNKSTIRFVHCSVDPGDSKRDRRQQAVV